MTKILTWIGSIFFGLIALCCLFALPASWGGLFFIIPALLINPLFRKLFEKREIRLKWPAYLAAVLVPLITTGVSAATSTPVTTTHALASSTVMSAAPSSTTPISSTALSLLAPASSQTAVVPTVSSGAKLKVHYIDVGQGDSEFLELPNGQTMLIDAGIPEEGQTVVNYIKGLGHNKIDYLIATHPHADHIGGMTDVVNSFSIGKFYMPKKTTTTKVFTDLIAALKSKNLGINVAKDGVSALKTGNLDIEMLAPVNITGDDLNQYSAVVKVTYGGNKFLFMGDAGGPSEEQITADVSADVLKVGHHGSNTASTQAFLNKVHPKYAVIEVGKGNSYGHPTAATLNKLQGIGATIYRTDNDGTIIFTSDSKTITVDKKASTEKQQAPPSSTVKQKAASSRKTTVVAGTVTGKKSSGSTQKSSGSGATQKKDEAPETDNQSVTVYITRTGKKYHRDGCRYLRKSQYAISLKDAKAEGYTPCSVCDPPE